MTKLVLVCFLIFLLGTSDGRIKKCRGGGGTIGGSGGGSIGGSVGGSIGSSAGAITQAGSVSPTTMSPGGTIEGSLSGSGSINGSISSCGVSGNAGGETGQQSGSAQGSINLCGGTPASTPEEGTTTSSPAVEISTIGTTEKESTPKTSFLCYDEGLTSGYFLIELTERTKVIRCRAEAPCLVAAGRVRGTIWYWRYCFTGGCDALIKRDNGTDFYYCQDCREDYCNNQTIPETPADVEN